MAYLARRQPPRWPCLLFAGALVVKLLFELGTGTAVDSGDHSGYKYYQQKAEGAAYWYVLGVQLIAVVWLVITTFFHSPCLDRAAAPRPGRRPVKVRRWGLFALLLLLLLILLAVGR